MAARTLAGTTAVALTAIIGCSLVEPAMAEPIGPKRPVSIRMVVLPAYTTEPLPAAAVAHAAQLATDELNAVGAGQVKVTGDVRPARRVTLPEGKACIDDPSKVIAQFPDTPNRRTTIYTVIIPSDQWCREGAHGGRAFLTSGSKASRIIAWPRTQLDLAWHGMPAERVRIDIGDLESELAVVLVHEMGHVLGLDHATSLTCRDEAGSPVPLSGSCTSEEYGDPFDIMGHGLSFTPITHTAITTGKAISLKVASPGSAIDLQASDRAPLAQRMARVRTSLGDVFLEYAPGLGVTARILRGPARKPLTILAPTALLAFGAYADGTPRWALVPGDVWALPGGGAISVTSASGDLASLAYLPSGLTALVGNVASPSIPSSEIDIGLASITRNQPLEVVASMLAAYSTVIVIKQDERWLVSDSWRPKPGEIGLFVVSGTVTGIWSHQGNPFDAVPAAT